MSGPQAQRSLKTIEVLEKEVGRLDEILEDFLRFARTDTLETQATDLNALVEEVLHFVVDFTIHQFEVANLLFRHEELIDLIDVGKLIAGRVDHVKEGVGNRAPTLGAITHDNVGFERWHNGFRQAHCFVVVF